MRGIGPKDFALLILKNWVLKNSDVENCGKLDATVRVDAKLLLADVAFLPHSAPSRLSRCPGFGCEQRRRFAITVVESEGIFFFAALRVVP
jgi:hypothetical protein